MCLLQKARGKRCERELEEQFRENSLKTRAFPLFARVSISLTRAFPLFARVSFSLTQLRADYHWVWWFWPPSLSPFSTSPCSFPIRIWEEFCQVQGSFFGNGRFVGVASCTSTGPSAKIGSICGIVDRNGFPCFNFSKSAQGVGKTIWNWHDLLCRNCLMIRYLSICINLCIPDSWASSHD